jgi:hypothetical protein
LALEHFRKEGFIFEITLLHNDFCRKGASSLGSLKGSDDVGALANQAVDRGFANLAAGADDGDLASLAV